ncbi:proline racemase family protein [Glaciibacter superstes]|uniref:proline racemase family protein n=1 Tax=Glaciibacter superstes TaxID=501023 RepID=UPI0003B4CB50|nr:proline racemase family protein [Glaciibacter superstes]
MISPAIAVSTVDYHTGGQPIRIVVDGAPVIPGATAAERRHHALNTPQIDAFRTFLCWEPRGHADMYGCYLFPADTEGFPADTESADFSAVFFHADGYPPSCGHGTMALGVFAVESGMVDAPDDGVTTVTIDVPAGRAIARVRKAGGVVTGVWLDKGASYPVALAVPVRLETDSFVVDLAFSGALFACVPADAFGLSVEPKHAASLAELGQEIRTVLNEGATERHPHDERLDGVFGVVFYDDLGDTENGPHQRIVNVFNNGWIDRSPCGSATGARLALLAQSGRLAAGSQLMQESIVGTRFTARALPLPLDPHPHAIGAEIEGLAHRTGEHVFPLDPRDPLASGFLLR